MGALSAARDAYHRLMFYAWCDGAPGAAWHVAKIAFDMERMATDELAPAQLHATVWEALRTETPSFAWADERMRLQSHAAAMVHLAEAGRLAFDVYEARATVTEEQRKREKTVQGSVLRDLLDNPAGGVQMDILQVLPEDIEDEEPQVRGRVVFPALEPTTVTTEGRRTGSSAVARGKVGHVAGKVLAYDPPADPEVVFKALQAEYPQAEAANTAVAQDAVVSQQLGYAWLRPSLLDGAPGVGKTRYARRAVEASGLRYLLHSAAGASDGQIAGTSAAWASARLSAPAQALLQFERANACLIIDEIDKAGTSSHNGRLDEALLPFLERETSRRIVDPMLEVPLDLSCMTYLMTANDLHRVAGPLRDRLRVLHIPRPKAEHLPAIARTMVADIREENGVDERWLPDLDGDELDLLAGQWTGGSMRRLRRLVEVLVMGRAALAPRH
ncbi:AAA family ATPase [Microvirga arvi]|uniref:AAA family ATPase n=1 Tax=Microvirga arvi TaxID=2778731 RepID=UPI00194DD68E|nr:AAA family ATPase [Microvirga arvi]